MRTCQQICRAFATLGVFTQLYVCDKIGLSQSSVQYAFYECGPLTDIALLVLKSTKEKCKKVTFFRLLPFLHHFYITSEPVFVHFLCHNQKCVTLEYRLTGVRTNVLFSLLALRSIRNLRFKEKREEASTITYILSCLAFMKTLS